MFWWLNYCCRNDIHSWQFRCATFRYSSPAITVTRTKVTGNSIYCASNSSVFRWNCTPKSSISGNFRGGSRKSVLLPDLYHLLGK
jgi:hypothetical protein